MEIVGRAALERLCKNNRRCVSIFGCYCLLRAIHSIFSKWDSIAMAVKMCWSKYSKFWYWRRVLDWESSWKPN